MIKCLYTILVSLLCSMAIAQEYSFVQYSVKEGLPQTQVYALAADDDGFLWLGTAGGAGKFNGKYFENYSSANGLADNVVSDIISYKSFTWIFTNKGVTRVKGKETVLFDLTDVLKGNYIAAAEFRPETNSLIIGIKNHEVVEIPLDENFDLKLKDFKLISFDLSLSNIRHLYRDLEGNIWLCSNGYLGYLDLNNNWVSQTIEGSSHNVSDVKQSKDGSYYISVYGEGLYHWNGQIIKQLTEEDGLVSQLIRTLFIDSEGRVWAASKNGVSVLDGNEISLFTLKNGLPNENIETICEDSEGNIWLASDGSGAFRFTSDEFVSYHQSGGIGSDYIMNIVQDTVGDYWFGTYGNGLTKYDGHSYAYFTLENKKLNNNIIWSSLLDSKSRLWFGSSDGLSLFEDNEIITFKNESWLPSNKVTSLFENKETNEIWIGTSKGVGMYGVDSTRVLSQAEVLPLKNIRTIEKGKNHQVWLGTSNGIYVTDGNFYEPWVNNDFLEDKVVYSIKNYKDSLWFIGTANGLYYSDGIDVVKMNLHTSFGANYINFLTIERNQYLWVGTNFGIFEIDLFSYLKDQHQGLMHHTENSGLTSVETNLNAAYVDGNGIVWMGTGNGLVRFDRGKRKQTSVDVLPKIEIKDVQLFLKKTNWNDYTKEIDPYLNIPMSLELTSRNNYLTFYFEGLSLTHPDEITYKIILEGLDEEWTPNISQNTFTYPNLSYGDYTFKVKSSIDGVHWSEPVVFSFTILKPYYLQWWFILVCVTLLGILVYVIYKWRLNVKDQKDRTEKLVYKSRLLALEQQTLNASMNRHFIFNALNSIQYYINTQDRLSANRYLTSFAKLIRKNLDSSVSTTGLVTLADELERLKLYVSLEHMRFQEKFDFSIELDEKVDVEAIHIPPMILQPFVENSIWHGLLPKENGGKLWVNIYQSSTGVVFEIEDNGIGYDVSMSKKTENSHHSQGMLITSGRLEILKKVNEQNMTIKGPFQLHGEDGKAIGTKVIMVLENKVG